MFYPSPAPLAQEKQGIINEKYASYTQCPSVEQRYNNGSGQAGPDQSNRKHVVILLIDTIWGLC